MKNKLLLLVFGLVMTTQIIFSQVPSYVPTNGLVGYWPFNGNANDQSGNGNNGTVNGATLTADRNGNSNNAYYFNGTSNYINLNKTLTSQFSISLWVSVSTFKTYIAPGPNIIGSKIISTYNNNFGFSGFECETNGNQSLYGQHSAAFWNSNQNNIGATAISNLVLNQWKNLIITYDGTNLKYYVNGIFESSSTTVFIQNNRNLFLGAREFHLNGPDFFFNGKLDDIGLWNRALTQQEITNMYNGVNYSDTCNAVSGSLVNGLVSYWPFCGNANDQSGNGNNGTVFGATLTTDRFGNTNSAFDFNGTNSHILVPNNSSLSNFQDITISGWVNISQFPNLSISDGLSGLVTKWYGSGNCGGVTDNYACYVRSNNQFVGATNQYRQYPTLLQTPSNINSANWYHFVMVHNSMTGGSFYINGILVSNYNTAGAICSSTNPLYFGCDNGLGTLNRFLNGKLDDIGIWNRALTQQEITQLYNQNQCITNITVTDTLIINVGQMSHTNPVAYANNITIYPNPASTQININFNNITDLSGGTIKIINSLGQQVASTPITLTGTSTSMALGSWGGNGVYFVQILNAQGQIVDIKKIILQ